MRRNPGRWLWTLLLPLLLWGGSVQVRVNPPVVTRGDTVTVTIEAKGSEVKFPVIHEIGGYPVLGTSSRNSISIINGKVERSYVKSYTFAPMKGVEIPPFSVEVDGDTLQTTPVKVKVTDRPAPSAKGQGGATLTLHLSKTHVRVGEPVEMEVVLRYPTGQNVAQTQFQPPEFEHFWIKRLGSPTREVRDSEVVERVRFLIFPQKAGTFTLGPLTAKIARRVRIKPPIDDPFLQDDFFNNFFAKLQWHRVASDTVKLTADPLPGGVELFGRFRMHVQADRTEVKAGDPVKVTIEIEGEGNVEDIPKFDFDIPDAVVYADDPKIKEWVKGDVYGGRFTQTITVVAEGNFTIPSLTLRYYDAKVKRVVTKRAAPIRVTVKGGHRRRSVVRQAAPEPSDENDTSHVETSSAIPVSAGRGGWPIWALWIALVAGFALGLGVSAGWRRWRLRQGGGKGRKATAEAIRRAKKDRELFDLLLPYAKLDPEIETALQQLEANLYAGAKHRIDRELMAQIVETIEENEKIDQKG